MNLSWKFLEGLMLKLKVQYFGHLMWLTGSLEKTLMLGKMKAGGEGDDRGLAGWMASLTQWTWVSKLLEWWLAGKPCMVHSMGSQRIRHNWVTELNWSDCFSLGSNRNIKKKIDFVLWLVYKYFTLAFMNYYIYPLIKHKSTIMPLK